MTHTLSAHRAGATVAIFVGGIQVLWSLLVALGLGEILIDFMSALHFVNITFSIAEFNLVTALASVAVKSTAGYFFGLILATIWNKITVQ